MKASGDEPRMTWGAVGIGSDPMNQSSRAPTGGTEIHWRITGDFGRSSLGFWRSLTGTP